MDEWRELSAAVVSVAVKDYRFVCRKLKTNPEDPITKGEMGRLKRFFSDPGNVYLMYLDIDGRRVLDKLNERFG